MAHSNDDLRARRGSPKHIVPEKNAIPQAGDRAGKFASEMARADFGRFYWNDDLERRLREALVKPAPAKQARNSGSRSGSGK